MYNNYYVQQYEAYVQQGILSSLKLDESYARLSMIGAIVVGILCMIFIALAVVFIKKNRPMGIVAAIAQPIGIVASAKCVTSFAAINFERLYSLKATSSVSMDDAMNKLYEKMGEVFMEEMFPDFMAYMIWAAVLTVTTVLTLIYICSLFGTKAKTFAVVSLIFIILRWVMPPIDMLNLYREIFPLYGDLEMQMVQTVWDVVYRFIYVLPPLFIGIAGLTCIKNGGVVEAPAPQVIYVAVPTEAAPAENTAEDNTPQA